MTDEQIRKVVEAQGGLETYWDYMMPRLRALVAAALAAVGLGIVAGGCTALTPQQQSQVTALSATV